MENETPKKSYLGGFKNLAEKVRTSSASSKISASFSKLNINYKLLKKILGVFAILAVIYYVKGFFVAAVVNGRPVTRYELTRELERRGGLQVLEGLINKSLIDQAANKADLKVTKEELDADFAKIAENMTAQGLTVDQALAQQNVTKAEFMDILKTNKQLEKLIADKVIVSDEEVSKYMADNKATLPAGSDEEALKVQVKTFLQQQKVDAESQKLFTDLREASNVYNWVKF